MANLSTQHMGVALKNPLILGASNLVNNIDNLKINEILFQMDFLEHK